MNREQRKQNLEFIKRIRAGKVEPWEGQVAMWFLDDDGNFTFKEHVIAPEKFDEFCKLVGGKHLVFAPSPGCWPIGTDPDEYLSAPRTLIERAKDVIDNVVGAVEKIFRPEPKVQFEQTPNSLLPSCDPEPVCDMAIAGFKLSPELIEARRQCDEWNFQCNGFNTETYRYGLQTDQI